jgi:tetratricopeptide (TPR) repeat protein
LKPVVSRFPNLRAFELLAEINATLVRPQEVLKWTEKGLALKTSRRLLEMRVEAADKLEEAQIALDAGRALLKLDPGYAPAARVVGRALQSLGRTDEAGKHYESLLKRNPEFLLSQVALKIIAIDQGKPGQAVEYAQKTVSQRPWHTDATPRLAVAQAEDQKFAPALKTLGPWLIKASTEGFTPSFIAR